MDHSLPLNAFLSVRPRGIDMPSAEPRRTNTSRAPAQGSLRALDARGNATVTLAPRTQGAITIENRVQSQASVDKRKRISKAGTK
ncbi:hypothetical protein [Acidovorax sp. LjRoot117]|uniref:hypothetical protein n=1 Tax=Acidovorax sp. LjRoot117 TaxID=3342255 RepID=UPI003ECE26C3